MVADLETASRSTTTNNIVQIAAIVIEPRNLEIIADSELNLKVKPDEVAIDLSTLDFHSKMQGRAKEVILEEWRTSPDPKIVWPEFIKYLHKYHSNQSKKTKWSAPIVAGMNIFNFDLPIINNYNKQFGGDKALFHARDTVDIMHLMFLWFENNAEINSYSLDNMRDYFGISRIGAHDALKDVKDCAEIIIRFLKLHRNTAARVKFRGAFDGGY